MAIKDGVKEAYNGDRWYYVNVLDRSKYKQHQDPQHGMVYDDEPEYFTSHWELSYNFHDAMFFPTFEEAENTIRDHIDFTKYRAVIRTVDVKINGFDIGAIIE